MGTIHRQGGFNFKINTDDHEPMHVHIWHQGNVLIVNFADNIEVRDNYGFNNSEMRRALLIVGANQSDFRTKWREIHNG